MNWKSATTAAVIVGAIGFAAGRVYSQDEKPKGPPSPEDTHKLMAEMGKLSDQHKAMAQDVGDWDTETSMWMDPASPPMKSKSSTTVKSINAGHYFTEAHKGDVMGMSFEGLSVTGYSKEKGKYFGLWCDSMSSTPEVMWGAADETGKVITFDGPEMDCSMGKFVPRWIVRHPDADHRTFEHWTKYPAMGDQYIKEIEVQYVRKGAK